jgi:transposase-like protein
LRGIVNLSTNLHSLSVVWHHRAMNTSPTPDLDKRHRFPVELRRHGVGRSYRFSRRYRDVEELMADRDVTRSPAAMRYWCRKCGHAYANALRRRRPRPGDKWHLDEVFLTINGAWHYLWRAVDQAGIVLDILVQRRRNKAAAKKFFRKLLKGLTCAYASMRVSRDAERDGQRWDGGVSQTQGESQAAC